MRLSISILEDNIPLLATVEASPGELAGLGAVCLGVAIVEMS